MTNFKYNEKELLEEFSRYVDSTYGQHYVGEDNTQSLDIIFSSGNGIGFTVGNVQKYSARYGKKKGHNRDDLVKAMHYCLLALYRHDIEHKKPVYDYTPPNVKINSVNEKGEITGVSVTTPMLKLAPLVEPMKPFCGRENCPEFAIAGSRCGCHMLPMEERKYYSTQHLVNLKYWYIIDKKTNKKVPDSYCFKTMSDAQGYQHSMREDTTLQLRTPDEE